MIKIAPVFLLLASVASGQHVCHNCGGIIVHPQPVVYSQPVIVQQQPIVQSYTGGAQSDVWVEVRGDDASLQNAMHRCRNRIRMHTYVNGRKGEPAVGWSYNNGKRPRTCNGVGGPHYSVVCRRRGNGYECYSSHSR